MSKSSWWRTWTWELFVERALSAFKYLMAVSLMISGFTTAFFAEVEPVTMLGFIYQSHVVLSTLGVIIFLCGLTLFYGKIRKSRRWTGYGLMSTFCCYLFATVLQYVAYAGSPDAWVVNGVLAVVMGMLYLRWRFKTAYIDPKHFRDDAERLHFEHHRLAP